MNNKIKKIIINIIIKNKAFKFSIRYFNSILLISVSILLIYKIVWNIEILIKKFNNVLSYFDNVINMIKTSATSTFNNNLISYIKIEKNNFISDGNGFEDFFKKIVSNIINQLKSILEPVTVPYSNELLANQINDIAIILFILTILIIGLIIVFIINTRVFVFSDKISNFFTNKYIKWYININKKFIGIELFLLGSNILYFMYFLAKGIRFIAIHPIIFT